jgi:diguanylate cyclase (GGDEF)-like protein
VGRRTALIIALASVSLIPAWSHAAETQAPLAVPGEPLPVVAKPASVSRPATLDGTFRVPRADTTLYIAAPWFVRDISVTLFGPAKRRQTIVAESTLPGRTLGLRLPLDAPLADRIELRATTVSAAGVPYLVTAEQLTTIGWRGWPHAAACGLYISLALMFGWFAIRARSSACGWFSVAAAGQAALMIPWLGVVRPPPQVSQPLHGLVQSVVYVALAAFALALFRGVPLVRRAGIALAIVVALNVLSTMGGDVLQDFSPVPDLFTQLVVVVFDASLVAIGVAALRAKSDGAAMFVAGSAIAFVGIVIDAFGPSELLRTTALAGSAAEAILFGFALTPQLRTALDGSSSSDGLTGIANRAALDVWLATAWRSALRGGTPVAAAIVNVDYFKAFNEAYGHLAGDDVLRRIASHLAYVAEQHDGMAGRFAGDKFLVVLPATSLDGARGIGDAVRTAVAALEVANRGAPSKRLSVSVGVASLVPDADDGGAELVRRVDSALYLAKTLGRNRVVADV